MNQSKICPFCRAENPPQREQCQNCGRSLAPSNDKYLTTQQVAFVDEEIKQAIPPIEQLGALANNTLVLFVSGEDEPVLIKDVEEIVLGRPMVERPGERSFDLTDYGAITLGVSRRHARISYANEMFQVIDLDSTNGSTLNGRYLPPAQPQRLQPFDQLALGQLRLTVFFNINPSEQKKIVYLTDRRSIQPLSMSPHYLTSTITPYIQALSDIQKISREVRGEPAEEIQVLHMQPGKRPSQIRLSLLINEEAIDIVRQFILPWQRTHTDPNRLTADLGDKLLQSQLDHLITSIVGHLASAAPESEAAALGEKLHDPVSFIATSGLELSVEEPQS